MAHKSSTACVRLVLLCKGSLGDAIPLISLSWKFILYKQFSKATIVVICADHIVGQLQKLSCKCCYESVQLLFKPYPGDALKLTVDSSDTDRRRVLFEEMHHTLNVCEDGADLVIFNLFALEGWLIAKHLKLPCLAASPFLLNRPPPAQFQQSLQEEDKDLFHALQTAQPGQISFAEVDSWLWRVMLDDFGWCCEQLGMDPSPLSTDVNSGRGLPPPTPLLYGVSSALVERWAYLPESILLCGPWILPSVDSPLPGALSTFCHKCIGPCVYVGFGSMETLNQLDEAASCQLVQALLEGLLLGNLSVVIQMCRGSAFHCSYERIVNQKSLQGKEKQIYVLLDTLPHSVLFQHCSVVIHHGGAGTCHTAALHGCAQIICPVTFDQSWWAQRLEWLGVGVDCGHPQHVTSSVLQAALKKVQLKSVLNCVDDMQQRMTTSLTFSDAVLCIDSVMTKCHQSV